MKTLLTLTAFIITSAIVFSSCKEKTTTPATVKPTADFSFEVAGQIAPANVAFTNLSKNAESYLWKFEDGGFSAEVDPTHQFNYGGNIFVTLVATGPGGSDTITKVISSIEHTYSSVKVSSLTYWSFPLKNADGNDWDPDGLIDFYDDVRYLNDAPVFGGTPQVIYDLDPTLPLGKGYTILFQPAIPLSLDNGFKFAVYDYDDGVNDDYLGQVVFKVIDATKKGYPKKFSVTNEAGFEMEFSLSWVN